MMKGRWLSVVVALVLGSSALWMASCIEPLPLYSRIAAQLVDRVCNDACGCGGESCRVWADEEADRLSELADELDLTFDDECFGRRLEIHASRDCKPTSWDEELRCGVGCSLLHGDRGPGYDCVRDGVFSTCQQGLVCIDSTCVDPCDHWAVGITCASAPCAYPTLCDQTTETCVAPPGEGEACLNGSQCEQGLECIAGTCGGPRDDGEACMGHDHCLSRNCPAGFCAPRPVAGESCAGSVACAEGLRCLEEVCVEGTRPGDPCPCTDGQTCDDGVCRYQSTGQCGGSFLVP